MTETAQPYCRIERFNVPECWTTRIIDASDLAAVEAEIDSVLAEHRQTSPLGATAVLHNRFGGQLQVGISDAGWLLIMRNAGEPTRILRGDSDDTRVVTFLLPEWTDFRVRDLLPRARALEHIRSWLDTGLPCPAR